MWEIENFMPPDELFEWESFLRYEAEERDKQNKKAQSGSGKGGRSRMRF